MTFTFPSTKFRGKINVVTLGSNNLPIGGQEAFNLHSFEGHIPHPPRLSLDVWDYNPKDDYPQALFDVYQTVMHDVGLWAKKCVEYGADIISLHLKSTSPDEQNLGADHAVKTVGRVLEEINVPLIVVGVDNTEKDVETLSAVAEEFRGQNLAIGPLTERNYKRIGAQALAYGHTVITLSPTDLNLAKQLNILLSNLGVAMNKIIMDPTAAALGYGMEYCYTVMEQLQIDAVVLNNKYVQCPMISFFGQESWKTKEANQGGNEIGSVENMNQGVMLEVTGAITMLISGASILCLQHPQSLKIVRQYIDEMLHNI